MDMILPIDIHCGKLLDWLISRRLAKKNWLELIEKVRKKIKIAVLDMPENEEIKKILSGTYISYFHCRQIMNILKKSESDSKNLLGFYTSQRLKDWQEIINLYETEGAYIAEAAQLLIRNVTYEIPNIKRNITRYIEIKEECYQKEIEIKKSMEIARAQFLNGCHRMGLIGNDLKEELLSLVGQLPELFDDIAKSSKKLEHAVEFYNNFIQFCSGSSSQRRECLSILIFLQTKGNTTVYEWLYGEPPSQIRSLNNIENLKNNSKEMNIIEDAELETDEIDWGDINIDTPNDKNSDQESFEIINKYNQDFVLDNSQSLIISEESKTIEKIAEGSEALTLLENQKTRDLILDNLLELQGFLETRLREMKESDNVLSISQLQSASPLIQMITVDAIIVMLSELKEICKQLTSYKFKHLLLIQSSPRYVDRLIETLMQPQNLEKQLRNEQLKIKKKAEDSHKKILLFQPLLAQIIEQSKWLQNQIQKDISARYNSRPVNIMGGANVV